MSIDTDQLAELRAMLDDLEARLAPPPEIELFAAPPALPPYVVTGEMITSTWGNANVNAIAETRTRRGVSRSATNQTLPAGVNTTDCAPPAGLAGVYAVTLRVSTSPAPSAIVIPSLIIAAQAYSGAGAPQTDHVVTAAVVINAGQVVQARVYNGGTLVNAAMYLTMHRVSW
jgi:hypothetical protein